MKVREMILNTLIENEHNYCYFGLRTDDRVLQVGDYVGNSHDWYEFYDPEYDHYGEELDGACATDFGELWYDEDDMDKVEKALEIQKRYSGAHQYLIAGDDEEYGDDDAEVIIRNAVVVAVIR